MVKSEAGDAGSTRPRGMPIQVSKSKQCLPYPHLPGQYHSFLQLLPHIVLHVAHSPCVLCSTLSREEARAIGYDLLDRKTARQWSAHLSLSVDRSPVREQQFSDVQLACASSQVERGLTSHSGLIHRGAAFEKHPNQLRAANEGGYVEGRQTGLSKRETKR